jgi:NAD(P)-dependent dehydrogenase (short-subunit alcohol dehydrogenase family)
VAQSHHRFVLFKTLEPLPGDPSMRLKPVRDQVVVIIGASSGIGRETALRFADRGAKVVTAARGEPGLRSLVDEIAARGGEAVYRVCDVADFAQVQAVAREASDRFGRIDTWVNVAATSVYGRFEETTPEEFRRVMEVNYLGQVHGALAALPHLRRAGGGALIAISSLESIVSLPLHASYSASKHAVEGAVDALRRELIAEGAPISVTSVKPGTINTPFFDNTRNKMDVRPQGPPPFYDPGVVADCVLYAAEHPVRDLFAGGAAKMMATTQMLAPKLVDAALARFGIPAERRNEPEHGGALGNLYAPRLGDSRRDGDFTSRARRLSVYTWMETHPATKLIAAGTVLAGLALLIGRRRGDGRGHVGPGENLYKGTGERCSRDEPGKTPGRDRQWRTISEGVSASPPDGVISQTGPGMPDDTSRPIEISPEEERRIAESIRAL